MGETKAGDGRRRAADELARRLGTPEGLAEARRRQARGEYPGLEPPHPAGHGPAGTAAASGAEDGNGEREGGGEDGAGPRPISIWQPREDGVWVRPEPSPLGDHYAVRREIRGRKEPGMRRVCFFGESAAAGYLYAPHLTPAGVLQVQLDHLAQRDRKVVVPPGQRGSGTAGAIDRWEVVDLARTNERCATLAATAEAAAQLEPDHLVVFTGNNAALLEASHLSPRAPSVTARQALAANLESGGGGTARAVEAARAARRAMAEALADLLARLATVARETGAAVTLVLPEVNLADWETREPPVLLPGDGNARWLALHRRAVDALAAGDPTAAEAAAWEMVELDGGTNPTPFRLLARALRARAAAPEVSPEEAVRLLEAARDAARSEVDATHAPLLASLAAPRAGDAVVRVLELAARRHGFATVDLRRVFAEWTGSPLPGRRLFLDYCHLTAEGMGVAMASVADALLRQAAAPAAAGGPFPAGEPTSAGEAPSSGEAPSAGVAPEAGLADGSVGAAPAATSATAATRGPTADPRPPSASTGAGAPAPTRASTDAAARAASGTFAGDGWRALAEELVHGPAAAAWHPTPAARATAHLGAAIHAAHRHLPLEGPGEPGRTLHRDLLEHHARAALDADPEGAAAAMVDLAEVRTAAVPALLTAGHRRNLARPAPLLLQHGWRWPHLDGDLLRALAEVLVERGRHQEVEVMARLLLERRRVPVGGEGLELVHPPHPLAEPAGRFHADAMAAEGLAPRAHLRLPWPAVAFDLVAEPGTRLELTAVLRRPAAPPGVPHGERGGPEPRSSTGRPGGSSRPASDDGSPASSPTGPKGTSPARPGPADSPAAGEARHRVEVVLEGRPVGTLPVGPSWTRGRLEIDLPEPPTPPEPDAEPRSSLLLPLRRLTLHWPPPPSAGPDPLAAAAVQGALGRPTDLHPVVGEVASLRVRAP